jgi:long-chain fatty acid transport protein
MSYGGAELTVISYHFILDNDVHNKLIQKEKGKHMTHSYSTLHSSFLIIGMAGILTATSQTHASGFQLMEQNASGLGNAYAGSAAVADDASAIFWNPAGMAYLPAGKMQVVGALNLVKPSSYFSNNGTVLPAGIYVLGGEGGDNGGWNFVPSAYFAMPVNDKISVGLGIGAPFGLKTEYDSDWMGRFRAIESDIKTININPSISYQASDTISLGLGVSAQKIDATLSNAFNASAALCAGFGAALCAPGGALSNLEGQAEVTADDWGYGYNLGVIFSPSPRTRVGLSYRSSIKYTVSGNVDFTRPTVTTLGPGNAAANAALAAATYNGGVEADVEVPDTVILSAWRQLDDRWEVMGDLSWTGWAKIQYLDIIRTDGAANGTTLSSTHENWRNTWRAAVGASYRYDDQWKFRGGLAYDQSPVDSSEYRTPRLPDNNRTWLSLGAQYKPNQDLWFDFGYTYIWVQGSSIDDRGGARPTEAENIDAYGWLRGSYDNNVNILAAQVTYNF